jgi:predicted nucleic acid-binding protein
MGILFLNGPLIDTNIILDFLLEREPFYNQADIIIKSAFDNKIKAYITATTVTDIYYITRKMKNSSIAKEFIKSLVLFIEVANVNKDIVLKALNSNLDDFEDAIQEYSAVTNGIDILVTRNERDFVGSKTDAITPEEFVNDYLH